MSLSAAEAVLSPEDANRRALRRLTLMILGGLGVTVLIVVLLVVAALQAVNRIDAMVRAREITQVERAIAADGGDLNYVTLDAMRQALDLDSPRLVTEREVRPDELSVRLGGDRVVAWTPHLFGAATFGQLAPARISLGLMFVMIVGAIGLNVRRVGRGLEQRRQEATELALTDALTGLGNRLAFEAALGTRLAKRESFALVLADLDRFKAINDAHGHGAGDRVLQAVARHLREAGRVDAARLGGDEFAVLCPTFMLEDYLDAMYRALEAPVEIEGGTVAVGASFGVARSGDFDPAPDALMRAADAALYRAKRRGGGAAELASPGLPARRHAA